jgi:hypothetical protein
VSRDCGRTIIRPATVHQIGVFMSILTDRELEFLASLRIGWRRFYWNELMRLLKEDDTSCDARPEIDSIAAPSRGPNGFIPS